MSQTSEKFRVEWLAADQARDAGLEEPTDVTAFKDISYGEFGDWNLLDLYIPKAVTTLDAAMKKHPVIISVHGGAFVYGQKETYKFYLMSLAQRGFAVVNFNYRLAPEFKFPAALEDTDAVLHWVMDNAAKSWYDSHAKINPPENFKPKAVALNCGLFDLTEDRNKQADIVVDLLGDHWEECCDFLNVEDFLTKEFPPVFVMTGEYDFLKSQNQHMAETLEKLGLPHVFKHYGTQDNKEISHVFHVNMKLPLAHACNDAECEFFKGFI